jgi:AraC family transcriptional activator of pobA
MQTFNNKRVFAISPLVESGNSSGTNPHQDNFSIICIREGFGTYCIEGITKTAEAGQLFFVVPGCTHHFTPYPGASGHIITFSAAFLTQTAEDLEGFHASGLSLRFSYCPVINTQPDVQEELLHIAEKMVRESVNYFLMRTEMLCRYLKIYLVHILRQMDATDGHAEPANTCPLVRKFTALLEKHFKEKKMVADYARELAVSSNHLNFMVKKYSGYSASYHIRQRIVLEAKRKAIHSDSTMKEIAYDLGFDDIAHFSKYFKNAAGNNFSSFKKAIGVELFSFA